MSEQESKSTAKNAGRSAKSQPKKGAHPPRQQAQGRVAEKPARESELEGRLREAEQRIAELNDQLLRQTAEFDNFRKRIVREKEESIKYANAALLADVIPVIDDFERAIQSATDSKDFDAFHRGVAMIENRLVSILERNWGLKRFSANGELFDPEKHEAIAVEERSDHDEAVVLEDYQKGYLLHDRVLRPAKVKVAKPVPQGEGGGEPDEEETSGQ